MHAEEARWRPTRSRIRKEVSARRRSRSASPPPASRKLSVLLIDLDPQASATKVLGVDVEERHTVADALLESERFSLRDVLVRTGWGFNLAPAETALASRESRRATADEFILRRQLADVVGYDVVDRGTAWRLNRVRGWAPGSHGGPIRPRRTRSMIGRDSELLSRPRRGPVRTTVW